MERWRSKLAGVWSGVFNCRPISAKRRHTSSASLEGSCSNQSCTRMRLGEGRTPNLRSTTQGKIPLVKAGEENVDRKIGASRNGGGGVDPSPSGFWGSCAALVPAPPPTPPRPLACTWSGPPAPPGSGAARCARADAPSAGTATSRGPGSAPPRPPAPPGRTPPSPSRHAVLSGGCRKFRNCRTFGMEVLQHHPDLRQIGTWRAMVMDGIEKI